MGIVYDEKVAKETKCHGYVDPKTGEKYLWSPGIIGMLSDEQEEIYCKAGITTKPEVPKRIQEFKEAVKVCKKKIEGLPKDKRLITWLGCMGVELKKRGIEV